MQTHGIILDLDGTVVNSPQDKLPSARVIKAIRALDKKYVVSAATGRSWSFAKPVIKALELTDPCIISAGTQICNPKTGEILWQKNIPQNAITSVAEIMREHPECRMMFNDMTEHDYFYGGVMPNDFDVKGEYFFIVQAFIPDELALQVHKKLSMIDGIAATLVVAQKPGFRDIHITNKSATKEHSIGVLLEMTGVKKEDVIGVGDGNNDIHLFAAVGHKVAMGNAVEALKKSADEVIGNVIDDGLAEYIEKLASKDA